jgi:ribosome-binding protein aMBF1 (putative translation factor)
MRASYPEPAHLRRCREGTSRVHHLRATHDTDHPDLRTSRPSTLLSVAAEARKLLLVGQSAQAYRVLRGLSQKGVARSAGVDVEVLRTLESGQRWPGTAAAQMIEKTLEVNSGSMIPQPDPDDV